MAQSKTPELIMSVGLLAVISCSVNLATTFTDSVFLSDYTDQKYLPYYLMAINFASLGLSMVILWGVGKAPTWKGFTVLCTLLSITALAARFGPDFGAPAAYDGAIRLVLIHTFALMINVATWNFAANQVHSSHARTWLPAMASGLTVGGLTGGVITVSLCALVKFSPMVTVDLLHNMTTVLLITAIPFPFLMKKLMGHKDVGGNTATLNRKAFGGNTKTKVSAFNSISLTKDPLVRFLATVTLLFAIAGTLADYQYKSLLQSTGGQPERVALFLGLLSTTLNILVLMGQWGFVSKLLNRTSLNGLFSLYPVPILGSIVVSVVMPAANAIYGAFLVRLLERSLRPLIFYSATDTLVAPMRSALKSRVIWLNKGIMTPLGTLLAMGLLMYLFEFHPALARSPHLIYGLMSFVLIISLFAGRSLTRIYQNHLRKSLGLDVSEEEHTDPQVSSRSLESLASDKSVVFNYSLLGQDSGLSAKKISQVFQKPPHEILPSLMLLHTSPDTQGTAVLAEQLKQQNDPNILLATLRLLNRSQELQHNIPTRLMQHDWKEISYLARRLSTNKPEQFEAEIEKELVNNIVKDRSFQKFGITFGASLEAMPSEKLTSWWETFFNASERNQALIFEHLAESFLRGTTIENWMPTRETGIRFKDLKPFLEYTKHHPLGRVLVNLLEKNTLDQSFWQNCLMARGNKPRVLLMVLCCFMSRRTQRNRFFYLWSQQMRHDDAFILSGFLECSCPVLRRKVICLYSLVILKFEQISFPKKPVVRGLQKTIRESLLLAGSMGEVFNYADNDLLLGLRYTGKQKNELYVHINRAYEHQIELFFAFSALLFGAQTTKQAYGRFRQGTDFTRANVVEFFRAGELQSVVSPMLNLLNISIPRDMVPFVIKELKLKPEEVILGVLTQREGFEWLDFLMESALLGGPHKDNIESYHKEHHYFNYLAPQDYVALVKKMTQHGPRISKDREKEILGRSLSLPPASLSALQARFRENA